MGAIQSRPLPLDQPIPMTASTHAALTSKQPPRSRLIHIWPVMLLVAGAVLQARPVVNPDHVEFTSNPQAVAYKKEITRDPATWQWSIPLKFPQVTHGVVHSASMNRDVGYNIYLPPGYAGDTQTRYPVVYYCHGATGSETSDLPVVNWVADQIGKGYLGKVIYVLLNAGHFSGYRDRPEANVMAETYVIQELIPEIDRRYRTLASREGRALMGFSMGGGGAVRFALKYPDLFCAVVSFGGSLGRAPGSADPVPGPGQTVNPDNLYHWATTNQARVKERMGLFFVVGGEDRMYANHAPFMEHLHNLGIDFHYRVIANLGHDLWGSMDLLGGETMRFLASHYEPARIEN